MRDLSVMEQKAVVGGYFCVKMYNKNTGRLVGKEYFNTFDEALDFATSQQKYFSVMIVPIDEPIY